MAEQHHEFDHEHGHQHQHTHEHMHVHEHTHADGTTHSHAHAHAHTHAHSHDHGDAHDHGHENLHDANSPHEHAHATEGTERTFALLSYMLDHNEHHAVELREIADELGDSCTDDLKKAIDLFEQSNAHLAAFLTGKSGD